MKQKETCLMEVGVECGNVTKRVGDGRAENRSMGAHAQEENSGV